MAQQASVTDNKDGTGVTVTVSGYTAAVLRASRVFSGDPLEQIASFAGDGSQVVSLDSGSYVGVWELDEVFGDPFTFRSSDAAEGIHLRALQAIRNVILSESLPGWPSNEDRHKIHKRPVRTLKEFGNPPHGVHYWMDTETLVPADNVRNSVTFPVIVAMVRGNDGDNLVDPGWTYSRELLFKSFPRCPLPGVPEIHTVTIQPGELFIPVGEATLNLDLQTLIFQCTTELSSVAH